jgi:hypothetical protein
MPKETDRTRTLSNISHLRNHFTFLSFRILYGTRDICLGLGEVAVKDQVKKKRYKVTLHYGPI